MEIRFKLGHAHPDIRMEGRGEETRIHVDGSDHAVSDIEIGERYVSFSMDGRRLRLPYCLIRGHVHVAVDGASYEFVPAAEEEADSVGDAAGFSPQVSSPMPGKILEVLVAPGQAVEAGAALLLMEAMKMETTVRAGSDAVVAEVKVKVGDRVGPGDVLVELHEPPAQPADEPTA